MTGVIPPDRSPGDNGDAGGNVQKAIEVLMHEHRLIEQVLGSLETSAAEVRAGATPLRDVIGEYAGFFQGFADACHHGKEEDILFERMIERGFPREAGLIAVMGFEHEQGRAHVRALRGVADAAGDASGAERSILLASADGFVPLLRQHILKEDRVLYPMALQVLTGPELDAMNGEFEAFEARLRGDGSYDRLQALAERLTARFRPDPERTAAVTSMSHCGR